MISITYSKKNGYVVRATGRKTIGLRKKADALMFVSDYLTKEKKSK